MDLPDIRIWNDIAPVFRDLEGAFLTVDGMPAWLESWNEAEMAVWGARAELKAARARAPGDDDVRRRYVEYQEHVMPPYRRASQALAVKLLAEPGHEPLPTHAQMMRRFRHEVNLSLPDDELAVRVASLEARFEAIYAAMTVTIDGKSLPMPHADALLRTPDRGARERAWRAIHARWMAARETIDDAFLELITARRRVAQDAGVEDFRAYRWEQVQRLDYTPDDCFGFHQAVEQEVLPLLVRLTDERRAALGVPTLRPWDLSADLESHESIRPYTTSRELEDGVGRILTRIDASFGDLYEQMRGECLDLDSIPGKPPGGEEFFRFRQGLPHIICNPAGSYDDVATLLHEFGHALHDYLSLQEQHLIWNLGGPDEFSELAAMAMMFLGDPYLVEDEGGPYTPEEARRVRKHDIEFHLRQISSIARMDAFQHWLYSEAPDDCTADDLDDAWERLSRRFSPGVDWSGLEQEWRVGWRQMGSFLFQHPFYYIEYGLSLLGAYGIRHNAMTDRRAVLLAYVGALKLGNTQPLPELYRAAGIVLAFNREIVRTSIAFMEEMLRT